MGQCRLEEWCGHMVMNSGHGAPAVRYGLDGVTVRYGNRTALDSVSFALEPGVTVLLGRNGAGKSTLCRVLSTAEQPLRGGVTSPRGTVGRTDLAFRREVGWLPQTPPVASYLRVRDQVTYAAWLKGVPRRQRAEVVDVALERTRLTARADAKVGDLSGGMLRRLGIAQAIVHGPKLLVLDEPSVGLDPEQRLQFYAILKTALDPDTVTLFSTHLLEDVAELARHVLVLDDGVLRFSGPLTKFLASVPEVSGENSLRSAFLAHLKSEAPA